MQREMMVGEMLREIYAGLRQCSEEFADEGITPQLTPDEAHRAIAPEVNALAQAYGAKGPRPKLAVFSGNEGQYRVVLMLAGTEQLVFDIRNRGPLSRSAVCIHKFSL